MTQPGYEYRGLMAESWDLFRGDTSTWEDRFFYRDLIEQYGQPILDVGCGTGRLLLDYLADGIDIDGLDNSPEMLALCREKAAGLGLSPALFEGDMQAFDLPRRYRVILVPSSSFQLVTDMKAARWAMRRFFEHLLPGGALVMPFMIFLDSDEPSRQTDWKVTAEETRSGDGALLRRWSRSRYDAEARLQHTEDRYEVWLEGELVHSEDHRRSPAVRWYSQAEAAGLYREAGFTDLEILSGFTRDPAKEQDTLFTVIGKAS